MQSRNELEQMLIEISNKANLQFRTIIQSDEKLQRQDTLKGILHIVDQYRSLLAQSANLNAQEKAKNYHIIYNTISYIIEILSYVQKSSFSFESIKPLVDCLLAIESNLVLADIKYLEKRTQIYLFLCKVYEQAEHYQPILLLLEGAIKKYEQLKKIYELDPPVQKYVYDILDNNIFILKVMTIKYSIHGNVINPNDWKKKTEDEFKDCSLQKKLICLIECLRTQSRKGSNIFIKSQKAFKEVLVQQGFDLIKPHLDILSRGLKQMRQKIEFEITFKQKTMTQTMKQQQINQEIKKKRQLMGKHIKQSQLKKSSKAFPLEYHAELIYFAYQVKNHKVLEELLRCAMIRVECRRIEVPYVTDVKIEVSNTSHINAKEGYDKIPFDLNQANLKEELKKLRKSGKTDPNAKAETQVQQQQPQGKDAKKAGKQAPQTVKSQISSKSSDEPTQWQLSQIDHKYVYMFVKRSYNPQKAIYDIKVVLGHEQKGPVGYEDSRRIIVPYIQKNEKVMSTQIQQYKGIRESTQMVPYIILSHSQNGLENEVQKKTLITDVQPIIGRNPMVPARLGYTKLNMDLRQVPQQFIKMPGQTYIFLTYRTDEQFHQSSRMIELFNSLVQLQASSGNISKNTQLSPEQIDKLTQLSITYSLQKLDNFFTTFQQTLKGQLGQQFYAQQIDFLTNLVNEIWTRYLQLPLEQIDYLMEQRLNDEIIDYDYQLYKEIISKSKPVFIKGLKVLNLVMINNKKCDIFLLGKISLELIKILEQNKQYFLAAENAKLAIDRIRMKRDQYLIKSVQALNDKLLPFAITCDNLILSNTINKMKQKFQQQRLVLQKALKVKELSQRKDNKPLSEAQLKQAELEWKLNRLTDQYDDIVAKTTTKHSEFSSLLAAIDFDLVNLYFRVSLKHADDLKRRGVGLTGQFNAGQLTGLADTLVKKLGFLQTKSNVKEKQNLKQLQTTLIKAQKLPPPKPQSSRPEKRLLEESYKNPYKLSLLLLNLGALNSGSQDKKYYLKESLKALKECQTLQTRMLQNCIQNSIFIFSSIFDSEILPQKASYKVKPFADLYNGTWPAEGQRAPSPILVGKNSQTIYIKLPPFVYKDKKNTRIIDQMKLYGKVSANGVDVSTNCDQLVGTGIKQPVGKIVKVAHLQPNNNYCFAVAPLNNSTSEMMAIGKTSEDIPTLNPLSISSIASALAKVAYQVGEYDIAEEAAKMVVKQFTEESKIIDPKINSINKTIKLKLNQSKLQSCSLLQIRSIAQSLYIMSLCQKRKLQDLKRSFQINPKPYQQKQRQILNLLTLCASLQPALPYPITSISLITSQLSTNISENAPLAEGYMLSLFNKQFLSPKIRKFGVAIIRQLMSWGLKNNEVSLVRRIFYKWASRKWIAVGKMIQVPAQEKKDSKKGGKDPKQTVQQQKMIDKFCHYMIEKSPLVMEQFQDSLVSISDEYSDLMNLYSQSIKQTIQQLAESTDNGQQKAEEILANLTGKIQLAELLKDSPNSIGKVPNTSKFYLEYHCKLIRRALEVSSKNDLKTLAQKIDDFQKMQMTQQVKISFDIFSLIQEAFENNIQFSPESKNWVKFIMEKTQKKELQKTIQIYNQYEQKVTNLMNSLKTQSFSLYERTKDYDYTHMWLAQLNHLKAIALIMSLQSSNTEVFKVSYKIKPIYTAIQHLSTQNLKKKQKQVQIIGADKVELDAGSLAIVQKILKYITDGIYSSFCIQNWIKFMNLLTTLINFLNHYEITPFYHKKSSKCWVYLSMISYMVGQMLKKIRQNGSRTFKQRYNKKLQNTQAESIYKILKPESSLTQLFEPLYEQYTPTYFIPQLSGSTSKQPWFGRKQFDFLNVNNLLQVIVYTIQTLNLGQKNEVIIQLLRQFCNATEHSFSLQLLPVLVESQTFILNQVQQNIANEQMKLKTLEEEFQSEKKKHKKKRTAQITGEKMQFQIDYEVNKTKILDTLQLLKEERNFIATQMQASKAIMNEIQRDCNKAASSQKQQKRYVQQFGQDEQNIWKSYQQPKSQSSSFQRQGQQRSSMNKMNILSKNRKNVLKQLIAKYEQLYQRLKNNKTSRDTLSEITNRNEMGNLCFALSEVQSQGDNINKAFQYWNDALATIFRKVNPLQNYLQILQQNGESLVANVGFKQLLIAIPIIYKVSMFCCHRNLQLQRKTVQFCSNLVYKLFLTSLVHPQHISAFANYRLRQFDNGLQKIFYHEEVSVGDISVALDFFITKAMDIFDNSQVILTLPMICLYEHVGVDILRKKQLAIKAKISKAMVLAKCGEIRASTKCLFMISQQKDMPVLWLEKSDNLKKQKGQDWCPQQNLFLQSKPFYSPENKQPIQSLKSLNFPSSLTSELSLELPILFNIAKNQLLSKIYESQITQNFELNEERINNLKLIQIQLRQCLRKLAIVEECIRLKKQYEELKQKVERQGGIGDELKTIDKKKAELQSYMKSTGQYDDTIINKFLSKNTDSFARNNLIQYMARTRSSVHKINLARNLSLNCFHIIKNGLTIFNRYCYNARRAQNGYDPELQLSGQTATQQTSKKDDKKAGKKQVQSSKAPVKEQIDPVQEQKLKVQMTKKPSRNGPNSFWHLKLTFQLGVLLYRQNNFVIALRIFEQLSKNCTTYNQAYFKVFSETYIQRCKLRLGEFNRPKILQLISKVQQNYFFDEEYVRLVMDFGQVFETNIQLKFYEKGLTTIKTIWQSHGMKKYLQGLLEQPIKKKYAVSDELTAQEQDLLKKKTKKVQEKKGGKQQKKAAKKQDPKKKKQESKVEYKASILKQHHEVNLFDDEDLHASSHFRQYVYDKHPNFYPANIYNDFGRKFIKCFTRYWSAFLTANKSTANLIQKDQKASNPTTKKSPTSLSPKESYQLISKLIKVAESYPEANLDLLMLKKLKSYFQKQQFLYKLSEEYVKSLSKLELKRLKLPHEDNPLNSRLTLLPSYFSFLTENLPLLKSGAQSFTQLLPIVHQVPLVLENDQSLDLITYEYAQTVQLLLEYSGTLLPKYAKLNDEQSVLEEKRSNRKLLVSQFIKLLQYSVDLSLAKKRLFSEYYTFSKKQLDASAKIDQDISIDLKNIDKQCKNLYPGFLKQSLKPKENITALDLLTYLLKIRREAQVMTFSNPLENTLKKCHRILSSSLTSYKQNCIIPLPDLQKPLDNISANLVLAKSKKIHTQSSVIESYIYILGNSAFDQSILYGKFNIETNMLSQLLENCYKIQSKLKQSNFLSQSVKERNYKQLQTPFIDVLRQIILIFGGLGTSSDPNILTNDVLSKNLITLSQKSIQSLINLFNGQIKEENEQLNIFLKETHAIKYRLREQKTNSTVTQSLSSQMNEKTLQTAK